MIKILVLDDEKGAGEQLVDFFAYRGYKVFNTIGGEQAILMLKKENPDILLLDIKMAGPDGLDVLRAAKEFNPEVRAIMITALKDADKKRQAKELGADEYIVKPFSYEELESLMIRVVNEIISERGD
ncbi:MAG: response regulator [Candidatus Omnitrophota bacterium]|nr:response regulator [Candidatus Omnitrophota bacterium]